MVPFYASIPFENRCAVFRTRAVNEGTL